MNELRLLTVEDNRADARLVEELLADSPEAVWRIEWVSRLGEALTRLAAERFDAVLLDLGLPDVEGLEGLRQVCRSFPAVAVVVLTGVDEARLGIQAVQAGAQDYLAKSRIDADLLSRALLYAVERRRILAGLQDQRQSPGEVRLIARSPGMRALLDTVRRVAATEANVLVTGESGTGKELISHALHELSPRRQGPVVVVDCSAIAESLIDSELFGRERGAYTGSSERRAGRLAAAHGGTLILDEIGELPLAVQAKLLRFVQERQIVPVGGTRPQKVDVRLIAVTNRDLEAEVAAGRFRADLYHRLHVVHLEVPPLAERPEDVAALADDFLRRFAQQHRKPVHGFTPEAEALLRRYSWPGNVRELQNAVLRAVILCQGDEITAGDLDLQDAPQSAPAAPPPQHPPPAPLSPPSPEASWDSLRVHIRRLLAAVRGLETALPLGRWLADELVLAAHSRAAGVARSGAALLGLPETTFRRRLAKARRLAAEPRPAAWESLRPEIAALLDVRHPAGTDLLDQARRLLLDEVEDLAPREAVRAAVLGVTPLTYRRWQQDRHRGHFEADP